MPTSLFALMCPHCGVDLSLNPTGWGACDRCGGRYLSRLGHLIPFDPEPALSAHPRAAVPPGNPSTPTHGESVPGYEGAGTPQEGGTPGRSIVPAAGTQIEPMARAPKRSLAPKRWGH